MGYILLFTGNEVIEVVAISDSTTLSQGETALLTCITHGLPYANISWMHNGQAVTNSSNKILILEEQFTEEGLLFQRSTLQICDSKIRDSGSYICVANNNLDYVNASTQLALFGEFYSLALKDRYRTVKARAYSH